MAIDYSTVLSRTRAFLMDASSLIWADADLQGAIRLALGEMGIYAGSILTLNGLDGAPATTLPAKAESLIVLGAAGYAGAARAADRSEAFELVGEFKDTKQWGEERLAEFRGLLGKLYPCDQVRTAGMRAATSGVFGAWPDDFGEKRLA